MRVLVLNTGGTIGMVGNPLKPAKSAEELLDGVAVPQDIELTLEDCPVLRPSPSVNIDDRILFVRSIEKHYDDHDAFVVLHGTDSLAETCAFLSMIFQRSLQKPLFVIGAQMTKDEVGSEVPLQIANTLRAAKTFKRQGLVGVYNVCLGDVFHGSRVRKRSASDFAAFHTPGRDPVARIGSAVVIYSGARMYNTVLADQGLCVDTHFEKCVASYRVSADTPPWVLMDFVRNKRLAGAILECKGAGNISDRTWEDDGPHAYSWIDVIASATKAGIHIGILSPFENGRVTFDRYALGNMVKNAGALSLESLTPEMADAKFRMGIALYPNAPGRIQQFLRTDIVGELLSVCESTS